MPQDNNVYMRAVALYDNNSESSDELSFRAGDVLTILELNYSGFDGWWLCSLRGAQGICPGNRLKIIPPVDADGSTLPKGQTLPDVGGSYVYDEPKGGCPVTGQQYDIVPPPVPTGEHFSVAGESYDVPRPLNIQSVMQQQYSVPPPPAAITPNLLEQYDVPKPVRPAVNPSQVEIDQVDGGEEYSVPRDMPVEVSAAMEWLSRLEAEASSAVNAVLSMAVSGWRRQDRISPQTVQASVKRFAIALHHLVVFARAASANASSLQGLCGKLSPLVSTLMSAEKSVKSCQQRLDAIGWTIEALAIPDEIPTNLRAVMQHDPLDTIVATAASIQSDISAFASFIQGNGTLLFAKDEVKKMEDLAYVNIECQEEMNAGQTGENGTDSTTLSATAPSRTIDPKDLKVMVFYGAIMRGDLGQVLKTVSAFVDCVEQNHPPREFINIIKHLLLTGERVVCSGDALSQSISCKALSTDVSEASSRLADALLHVSKTTRDAAIHFPNIATVQKMVDSVYSLSDHARRLNHFITVS